MHIGITIGLIEENETLWINGIKLNALFLSKALQATGHQVTILDTSQNVKSIDEKTVRWDLKEFPADKYVNQSNKVDLMIMLGTSFPAESIKQWKRFKPKRKVIKYHCGNNYVIDMERSIFPKKDPRESGEAAFQRDCIDEVWYVPQQGHQNRGYYAALYNLPLEKVIPVPFIWDPCFLDEELDKYDKAMQQRNDLGFPVYVPGKPKDKLNICVMEPNLNVVKFNMLPILIVELWKREGNKFGTLNLMSSNALIKNSYWKSIIKTLDLSMPGDTNLKVHGRIPVVSTLSKLADIVVSHQWHNPLNYAYLDTLYLRYPLIHNAEMIKDAGYYYPDFEIHKGYEQLKLAVESHDDNLEEYNDRSEAVLERYTVFNDGLVDTYKKLIQDLMSGKRESGLTYDYDWKTNLYKK